MDIEKTLKEFRACACILKGRKLAAKFDEGFISVFPLKEESKHDFGVCSKCLSKW
jgi:hypothetical protein